MKKFSSTYGGLKDNFVVFGDFKEEKPSEKVLSVLSVVQNILQRGNKEHSTKPSIYLKSVLGELKDIPTYLLSSELAEWSNIKGDTQNIDYPACTFFENFIPKYWKEYAPARNLVIPEARFKDILGYSTELDEQQVDFYIPQLNLVIEIDGSSHDTQSQQGKDTRRDRALKQNAIRTLRIKTSDIRNETQLLSDTLISLYKEIKANADVNEYVKSLNVQNNDLRLQYDTVMRLQMAILELLKCGIWKVDIETVSVCVAKSDVANVEKLLEYAYNDICLWVKNILQLLDFEFEMPKLHITSKAKKADVVFDYSVYNRWTDNELSLSEKCVCVRNDYYYKDNFYKVATADTLKYDLNSIRLSDAQAGSMMFFLKNIFGFDEFRDGQLHIISNILAGNDTIGILPTGTGKSLCYQFATLLQPGVAMVIVPIIALMKDQNKALDKLGIGQVAYISSDISALNKAKIINNFVLGKYQIMIVTPERFQNLSFRTALQKINIQLNFSLAVIDEVHCMSEWGHDFRVSYLSLIPTITKYCPEAKILGLTATASAAVLKDLKAEFKMQDSGNVKALTSMNRDELVFKKKICASQMDKEKVVEQIIQQRYGTYTDTEGIIKPSVGILFCPNASGNGMKSCLGATASLKNFFHKNSLHGEIQSYHGKLLTSERTRSQDRFMQDDFSGIMVCTKAFGIGIDKANIKFTIHSCLPESMEAFYQEAGRAGRDKDKTSKSYCYILYEPEREENNHILQEIFYRKTNAGRRKTLSKSLARGGDLSTRMFFWNDNKQDINDECANTIKVLRKLYGKENQEVILPFDETKNATTKIAENGLQRLQESLYKLSILGIVDTWTVEYDGSIKTGNVCVHYNDANDIGMVRKKLQEHIRKYDVTFSLRELSDTDIYNTVLQQTPNKPIKACLMKLIEWTNDNVIYARLQSLQTMIEVCADSVSDEAFRQKLNGYFAYTDETIKFDNLQLQPHDYKLWFDVLQKIDSHGNRKIITKIEADELLSSLARYLESYANNTAFNYLSGMLRLICGTFENTEGEWRFKESLQDVVKYFHKTEQEKIFDKTLDIIETLDSTTQNIASTVLCEVFYDKVYTIHERLHDIASLTRIIKSGVLKIQNIMEV